MSCSIGSTQTLNTYFQGIADSLANCTGKIRETCSSRVSARVMGAALAVIGLLVAAAGIVVAAAGLGCAVPLAIGLILVIIGSVLLGLGLAKTRSRRSELEQQLAAVFSRIEYLKEEHKNLNEVYALNCEARKSVSQHCQSLEKQIWDLCKKHADTISVLEEDARQDKERCVSCFQKQLKQSQDTCERLTRALCNAKNQCAELEKELACVKAKKK
jgi:IncA protein.